LSPPSFVAVTAPRSHLRCDPGGKGGPPDPVATVGSGKGSDTDKRNRTGAVPLGTRPQRRICCRLVQGEMILIFPLSLLVAYFVEIQQWNVEWFRESLFVVG
jgi:hypothetical protein